MKIRTFGSTALVAVLLFLIALVSHAATVNVFLDDGTLVPGSSNTDWPYAHLDRDMTWDVLSTAETNLSAVGAAVMEVRLMTVNNGSSRRMTQGGGSGLSVIEGPPDGNNAWMDNGEAAFFQLTFYDDIAKTTEIIGLDITFKSVTSRLNPLGTNMGVNAFASSREFVWNDFVPTNSLGNEDYANLAPYNMFVQNDTNAAFAWHIGMLPPAMTVFDYYTMESDETVAFDETDTFWLRRENFFGSSNLACQVGAIAFDVAFAEPEDMIVFRPSTGFWYGSYSLYDGFNDFNHLGSPAPVDTQLNGFGWSWANPLVGDINGDGLDDMVVVQDVGNDGLGLWQWAAGHSTDFDFDGDGEMGKTITSMIGAWGNVSNSVANLLADITGDGIQDMVTVNSGYWWNTYPSTSTGIATGTAQTQKQWGIAGDRMICGDFNGDGMDDIGVWRPLAATNYPQPTVLIKLTAVTNGVGTIGIGDQVNGYFGNTNFNVSLVGDINGDGRDDLVLVDTNDTSSAETPGLLEWAVAYGQTNGMITFGGGWPTNSNLLGFGFNSDVPMLADVNGDGRDDLVVVRNDNQWFCAFTAKNGNLINNNLDTSANFGTAGDIIPLFGQLNVRQAPSVEDLYITMEYLPGTGLELTWDTLLGFDYTVEVKTDLLTSGWATNTPGIAGTGGDVSVTTEVSQAQSFYQVIAE